MPKPDFTLKLIKSAEDVRHLSETLMTLPAFALDIETTDWWNRQRERVALLQMAFRVADKISVVVIDALAGVDIARVLADLLEEGSLVIADLGYRGIKFQTQMYEEEGILFITRADIESRSLKITHSLIRQRVEGIFSSLWQIFATRVHSRSWRGLWNTLKLKMLDYKLCFANLISYA